MKKLTLILLSVLLSVGAWAATVNETIYSMSAPTAPTEALAAQTGADLTATYVNGTGYIYNGHGSNPAAIVYNNGINLAGSGGSYFKLTIADGKLAVGDVIDVTDGTNSLDKSGESKLALYVSTTTTKGSLAYNFPYTITEEDVMLIGSKELYFWKNGANFFRTVSITRAAEGGTENLSFTSFETSKTPSFTANDVNVVWRRGDNNNIAADSKSRGIRMTNGCNFTITVPVGAKISQVQINWGSNGNLQKVNDVATGNFLDASITNASDVEVSTLTIPAKVTTTTWNAPYDVKENVLKFTQTGNGDIYVASLQVSYYTPTSLPATVTFSLGGASVTGGTVPAEEIVEPGNSLTIPVNTFLYKEGYTLTGWTDGENTYAAGDLFTPTADATLTAVFTANTKNIVTMEKELTLRWPFALKNGCQEIAIQGAGKTAYIIRQASVDDEMQDLALKIDASAGKFNNAGREDEWAQVNGGTVISFPSNARATITSKVHQDPTAATTLDGVAYTGYTSGVATWAANPTDGISTLTVAAGSYYSYIELNIPKVGNPWDNFQDITVDLSNGAYIHSDETSVTTIGIKKDGENVVRTTADDAAAIATIAGKFHSDEHGLQNFSMTIAVPGPVKITAGTCAWGGNLIVSNAEGTFSKTINTNTGACFHQNKTTNVVSVIYTGAATTLTISGGNYMPYIAVKSISDYNIVYSLGESGAEGTLPANLENQDPEDQYTVPANRTLYKEGYTLKGWTDGENNYLIGESYTMTVGDYTLTPVFVANTVALGDAIAETTIHWEFQTKEGAPVIEAEGNSAILVAQAIVNGETIDVCLNINATSGKFNNKSNNDWAQVNPGTEFTFPSEKFAIVKAFSMQDPTAASTLDGEAYTTYTSNVATWTANPTSGVSTLIIQAGSWYRYLELTIPAAVVVTDHMTAAEWAAYPNSKNRRIKVERTLVPDMYNTLCVPYDWTLEGGNFDAYFGAGCEVLKLASSSLENNELVLTFASTNKMTRGTAYLVKPTVEVSSWIVAASTKSDLRPTQTTAVDFIATYLPIELTASENTLCVGANDRLFYVGATSTMKGLRAYFTVKGAAAGAPARISLGGQVATGLENDNDNANVNKLIEQGRVIIRIDGHDYDLNGRLLK